MERVEANHPETTVEAIVGRWSAEFEANPKAWGRFAGRYVISIGDSRWLFDCGLRPRISPYHGDTADFELSLGADDFRALTEGSLNPQAAFLERKLKVRGTTKHALRFNLLLDALLAVLRENGQTANGPRVSLPIH